MLDSDVWKAFETLDKGCDDDCDDGFVVAVMSWTVVLVWDEGVDWNVVWPLDDCCENVFWNVVSAWAFVTFIDEFVICNVAMPLENSREDK